jgi:L-aminopeptidase/D-esterase-like protein
MVEAVDAICLSGGSAFGLQAADGVAAWLAEQGRGHAVGPWRIPIVPGAILFDLASGGTPPPPGATLYRALAIQACEQAGRRFDLGNAGAGTGARAGRLKGGLGSASAVTADGITVGALVAANPVGAVTMPGSGTLWAWALERHGEMGGQKPPAGPVGSEPELPDESRLGGHTTIAVVATDAILSKAEARRVAVMAHDGMARAIRPVHTPFDGDSVFAISTGQRPIPEPVPLSLARIGALAADCLGRAIGRAVFEAARLGDIPCYRELYPDAFTAA